MNNPTWVDKLMGQIPGKTESVSVFTLLLNLVFGGLCAFGIICLSAEAIVSINGALLSLITLLLGAKGTRTENTVNQVQAAQTTSIEAAATAKETK